MRRPDRWAFFALSCLFVLILAGCSSDPDGGGTNNGDEDVSDTGTSDVVDTTDTAPDDTGEPDTADTADTTETVDTEDTADTADADSLRTLSDYRTCFSSSECPNGMGECVIDISLNRPAVSGADTIAVADILPGLTSGQGVCTRVCTNSPDICQDLTLNDLEPDPIPHECQLVFVDESPYPSGATSFPLDPLPVAEEMVLNAAFGAICRPPFGLDPALPDSMCSSCTSDADCDGDAACWDFLDGAPSSGAEGTCVAGCDSDDDCPGGFACDLTAPDQATYCRPIEDTCSNCRDHDGDGRGDGRCGAGGEVSETDCDDFNADAYYDSTDMEHPFPTFCGEHDFNCNGLSDAAEQIGAAKYPQEHCSACNDTCSGDVPNGVALCTNVDDGTGNLAPECVAQCNVAVSGDPTHSDCNGALNDGCEVAVTNPDSLIYLDADSDSFGDPSRPAFLCAGETIPSTYVTNNDDCDDNPNDGALVYPGAPEICDNRDNNCDANGLVDETYPTKGNACSDLLGECYAEGFLACETDAGGNFTDNLICDAPFGAPVAEVCDGKDNDCDGVDDNGVKTTFYRDVDGDTWGNDLDTVQACAAPSGYVTRGGDCHDNVDTANPGNTEETLCDAFDDDCDGDFDEGVKSTFYADIDNDGYGGNRNTIQACFPRSGYIPDGSDCYDFHDYVAPNVAYNETNSAACMIDKDGDGWGSMNTSNPGFPPHLPLTAGTDCNDDDDTIRPDAVELCDADKGVLVDNDCDTSANEGCPDTLTIDYSSSGASDSFALPAGSTGTTSGSLLCNNNEVLVELGLGVDATFGKLYDIKITCRRLMLDSIQQNGVLDRVTQTGSATIKTFRATRPIGINVDGMNLSCKYTPAGVITDLEVEPHIDNNGISFLKVDCSRLQIDLPVATDPASNPATLTHLPAMTSQTVGTRNSLPAEFSGCQADNAVGTGVAYTFSEDAQYPPGTPYDQIDSFQIKCRKLDMGVRQ